MKGCEDSWSTYAPGVCVREESGRVESPLLRMPHSHHHEVSGICSGPAACICQVDHVQGESRKRRAWSS